VYSSALSTPAGNAVLRGRFYTSSRKGRSAVLRISSLSSLLSREVISRSLESKNKWQETQNSILFLLQLSVVFGRYSRTSRLQRGHTLSFRLAALCPIFAHSLGTPLSFSIAELRFAPRRLTSICWTFRCFLSSAFRPILAHPFRAPLSLFGAEPRAPPSTAASTC
jgi:hypothetical protein